MKINRLEYYKIEMPLEEPYTIAYDTIHSCTNVILKVTTDTGLTGWGCAAPDESTTGENAQKVMAMLADVIEPYLKNKHPFHYARHSEELKSLLPDCPSSRAMADIAIYDLMAKQAEVPLYEFLGGYRSSIPTSVTIGILPVDKTLERAKQWLKKGFYILKIKGGTDLEMDIEKVIRLRETIGPDIVLRFDANQGYTAAEAIRFVSETRSAGIELLEQPTPTGKDALMGEVSGQVHIPVMADESLQNLKDVFRLTNNDQTDMINIKLQKVGGITEAMHINSVGKAADVEAMVGCMDECQLGIAAGLHFALSRPNIFYADLDGHLDLLNDPFHNLFTIREGVMYPGKKGGLGHIR